MRVPSGADFPEELLEAAADGRLVIFVGAGASIDAPSGLPSFKELVRQIVERLAPALLAGDEDLIEHRKKDLDVLLSEVDALASGDDGSAVHAAIRSILSAGDPEPNAWHAATLALSGVAGHPRIVTTNYDELLEAQYRTQYESEPIVWQAPGLPRSDFVGVVHVHGGLSIHHPYMVAAADDFSRAYITQG